MKHLTVGLLFTITLLCSLVFAQPTIEAPATIGVGSGLVRVSIHGMEDGQGVIWFCSPDDLDVEEIGSRIVFASGCVPKRVVVNAIVGKSFLEYTKLKVIIEIVKDGPEPPIPPIPPVPPVPPVPPGPRRVVVISESESDTAAISIAINGLSTYAAQKGHNYNLFDPDQAAFSQAVARYTEFLSAQGIKPPAILVIATVDGKEVAKAVAFPNVGTTGADGTAAAKAAIAEVQKLGG